MNVPSEAGTVACACDKNEAKTAGKSISLPERKCGNTSTARNRAREMERIANLKPEMRMRENGSSRRKGSQQS
jgi:hypothetical protein